MFDTNILISLFGASKRTFWRRIGALRNQGLLPQGKRSPFFDEKEAKDIAEQLGFKMKFDNYVTTQYGKQKK